MSNTESTNGKTPTANDANGSSLTPPLPMDPNESSGTSSRNLSRTAAELQDKPAVTVDPFFTRKEGPTTTMTRLRGLAKNRAEAMNAAPTLASRENIPPQDTNGCAIQPLLVGVVARNQEPPLNTAPTNRGRETTTGPASDVETSPSPPDHVMPEISRSTGRDQLPQTQPGAVAINSTHVVNDTEDGLDEEERESVAVDGLVEAMPVQDDTASLMEAQEVDPEDLQRKASLERKGKKRALIGCAIVSLCCIALALAFGLALGKKDEKKALSLAPTWPSTPAPSDAPSSAPTGALDMLLQDLPNYTLQSLQTYSSPQSQARVWLSNHPELPVMEEWRKKQLFAIVTFFYTMEGLNWPKPVHERWLLYDEDECYWFSNIFGFLYPDGYEENLDYYNVTPCNQDGAFSNLILDGMELSGYKPYIPPEIDFLSSLESLVFGYSGINASIAEFMPSEIFQLTNLKVFDLYGNSLSGPIPTKLGLMTNMEWLDLAQNSLTGPIPTELGLLTSTTTLHLMDNNLSGSIPTELVLLTNATSLILYGNSLTGSIPTELGLMAAMVGMSLSQNALTGHIPSELGLLTSMENLYLYGNRLSSSIPSELGTMATMVDLALFQNALTGPIPAELSLTTNMEWIFLDQNRLSASIPSELGMMTNMALLWLDQNSLTGTIPSELGLLAYMTELWLHSNSLSGSIPSQLGLLNSMTELLFYSNSLFGSIPSELGTMTDLAHLKLENNALSGAIPEELGALAFNGSLATLTLANNSLTGTVPESVCSLGLFDPGLQLGLSFDCSDQLCGCCWCPCPGSNVSSTECQTHPLPGLFPTNGNGSISIAINIHTDAYPEEITFEWSLYSGPGFWELLETHRPEDSNSVNSYTELVESNTLYRLRLFDSYGDGIGSNGWFLIADSTPSPDNAEGSIVWHATGDALESSLDVFIWIDIEGHAQQVEYLPGEKGYALIHDKSETGQESTIVLSESFENSTSNGDLAVDESLAP